MESKVFFQSKIMGCIGWPVASDRSIALRNMSSGCLMPFLALNPNWISLRWLSCFCANLAISMETNYLFLVLSKEIGL